MKKIRKLLTNPWVLWTIIVGYFTTTISFFYRIYGSRLIDSEASVNFLNNFNRVGWKEFWSSGIVSINLAFGYIFTLIYQTIFCWFIVYFIYNVINFKKKQFSKIWIYHSFIVVTLYLLKKIYTYYSNGVINDLTFLGVLKGMNIILLLTSTILWIAYPLYKKIKKK